MFYWYHVHTIFKRNCIADCVNRHIYMYKTCTYIKICSCVCVCTYKTHICTYRKRHLNLKAILDYLFCSFCHCNFRRVMSAQNWKVLRLCLHDMRVVNSKRKYMYISLMLIVQYTKKVYIFFEWLYFPHFNWCVTS